MQHAAAKYLAQNYKLREAVSRVEYCPNCLKGGSGKVHNLGRKWSGEGESTLTAVTKEDNWKEIFEQGVDPVQALKYEYIFALRPRVPHWHRIQLLNLKKAGRKCPNAFTCDQACALCFAPIGSVPTAYIEDYPGFAFHKSCCQKCSFPLCPEMVPSIPGTMISSMGFDPETEAVSNLCKIHRETDRKKEDLPIITDSLDFSGKDVKRPICLKTWLVGGATSSIGKRAKDVKKVTFKKGFEDANAPSAPSLLPASLVGKRNRRPKKAFDFDFSAPVSRSPPPPSSDYLMLDSVCPAEEDN
jgi:hypothetical protein